MRKIFAFTVILGLIILTGCKYPLFNPKADAMISYFTNTSNAQISSLTLSGDAPHAIRAFVTIANGVDVRFSDYSIDYYTVAGNKIPLSVDGETSAYIGGTGTTPSSATGYVGLNITNADLVSYKTANSISQLNLQILLNGEDINGNLISIYGTFPIY